MKESLPKWLSKWRPADTTLMTDFFASRVVFYPGSGTDGQPVEFFGSRHAAHCFVYADYGVSRDHALQELGETGHPFAGYRSVGRKELQENDLTPNGWNPHTQFETPTQGALHRERPYAFVEILERRRGFGNGHGPRRLAILILCTDGVEAYDSLFCQANSTTPFAVVLQDHGYGGNWTKFGQGGELDKLASIADRMPQYLLVADNTDVWAGYSAIDGVTSLGGGMHGFKRQLWRRSAHAGFSSADPHPLHTKVCEVSSTTVVDNQSSSTPDQRELPIFATTSARPSALELFFNSIRDSPAALALITRMTTICEEQHVRVHHTNNIGGDLRIEVNRLPPGRRTQNVVVMVWSPKKRHFRCEVLLPPEECVMQGIPTEGVGPNTGKPLPSRLFVREVLDDDAFLSVVRQSILRFQEQ